MLIVAPWRDGYGSWMPAGGEVFAKLSNPWFTNRVKSVPTNKVHFRGRERTRDRV